MRTYFGRNDKSIYEQRLYSDAQAALSALDTIEEESRWRNPKTEWPEDELMRCEVVAYDQVFIAWPGIDEHEGYWLLDAPSNAYVGDIRIEGVRAWRPATIPEGVPPKV